VAIIAKPLAQADYFVSYFGNRNVAGMLIVEVHGGVHYS